MKKTKGITLIALIITIIVMLILVAVTVSILINSNLLGNAQRAADETRTAYNKEGQLENEGKVGNENLGDYMQNLINKIDGENGGGETTGELQPGEKSIAGKSTYKNVPIPEGFTVSGIADESNSIADGIVIYDIPELPEGEEIDWEATTTVGIATDVPTVQTLYNQYVWVPVEKAAITKEEVETEIRKTNQGEYTAAEYETAAQNLATSLTTGTNPTYPMAIQCADENYRGLLYDFGAGIGTPATVTLMQFSTTADYTSVKYYREPAYLTDSRYADANSSYNTIGITQASLQTEYNNIVKSVAQYGGFFVARYELTQEGTSPNLTFGSKRGKTVANAGTSSANMWYGLYTACQTLDNNHTDKVTSTMISGSQWDQIMIWMKEIKNTNNTNNYYVVDSSYMGNYSTSSGGTGSRQVSGYSNNYSVKKVFDLGGNLTDWTTESFSSHHRVLRGSCYNGDGSSGPASFRSVVFPYRTASYDSARPTLYINL